MTYNRKVLITLFFVTFSLSTLLSVSGLSNEIATYFRVEIMQSTIYLGMFLLIVGITALFLPAYLSRFEKKKFLIISLFVTIITVFLQVFIDDFYIAVILRIIPAFFYSTAISFALTYIGELDPNNVNKVVLGITSGTVFGASFSIYLATSYGFDYALVWIALINMVSLILTVLFLPEMKGKTESFLNQFHNAKSGLFMVSIFSILFIGIGVSITYNFFTLLLETITKLPYDKLSLFIFFNGLAGVFGTSLMGRLMQKNLKLSITAYPFIFILLMMSMIVCIEMEKPMFVILILFGILDGSMQTIAQYTITSAARDTPEFANGFYLFIVNLNRTIGIVLGGVLIESWFTTSILIMSVISFVMSIPFIVYRFKRYSSVDLLHNDAF
ncbi:MFS transporter [uncultured Methanobrevibacter sp.]|uniref:MFS transporter n=1 Tax=uncultured Methanobrevibacter sp. TaxID=253161 RepID=UPI0025F98FDB|nr:MFS transporter [uncultured Methanobrevibacter sp.]